MNKFFLSVICFMLWIVSCKKSENPKTPSINNEPVDTSDTSHTVTDTFVTFVILKGNNYCENNSYPLFKQSSLKFKVIFDSSCIYENADPINQWDINKLYGFSDCNTLHHANSARFGWNWLDGKMHIHGYCYADSVRSYKELGIVELNKEIECSIELLPSKYIFTLNGKKDTMDRHCSDTSARGYKLFPYFGGDEPAPKDIKIRIKDLK